MKTMKKIWFVFTFLLGIQLADAQIGLFIYTNDTIPSPVTLGNSFSFNAIIRNDSSSVLNERIGLGYSVNGSAATTVSDSTSGLQFDSAVALLNPGDTVAKTIVVHVSGPQFLVGPSVVVIWPISTHGHALDSLTLHINVLEPAGIAGIDDRSIKAYIVNNEMMIQVEQDIQLRQVRIFDVSGREILSQINPSRITPLPQMESGIYLAEITYNNNQRKLFKFFK